MANTFTEDANSPLVVGNSQCRFGVYNATDGVGSSVASGLEYIYNGSATPKSATTGNLTINANVDGDFGVLSAVSGDTFYVRIWGR